MPSDLPLPRRPAPSARPGASDSPWLGVLLGIAIGAAVMLVIGATYLVLNHFHPLASHVPSTVVAVGQPGSTFSLPTLALTATPAPTEKATVTRAPTRTAISAASLPVIATSAPARAGSTSQTYTVQPGDSLYQIARRFNIDVLDLMIANHIANPSVIQPGQVFTIPAPGTVARGPAASGPKSILVDIPSQQLYAYQGNTLVYNFTVSTGQYDGTLRGDFQILDKLPRPYSSAWNFWMPDWLGFYYAGGLENGFHALPVLPDGSTIWGDTIGTPTTYGCVVLNTLEAQLLYQWADVGTPVKVQ
jgi:LysM repeat protein